MSVLLSFSKLMQKADPHLFKVEPSGLSNFEDSIRSDTITAYELLNISNNRSKLLNDYDRYFCRYKKNLQTLLQNHKSLSYIDQSTPLVFEWKINDAPFKSTSLFFEYYMLQLMDATQKISKTITNHTKDSNNTFKLVKNNLLGLLKIFPEWKTQQYIQPSVPFVVTEKFVKQLIYFCHATQALYLSHKKDTPVNTVALATASHYYDKVWFRAPIYGNIAFNHLALSKALLHFELGQKVNADSDAEKKYKLLQEAKQLYELVSIKNCFLTDTLNDIQISELVETDLKHLESVYYTTGEYDINELKTPKVVPLKVCQKTGNFGCKCIDDSV